MICSDKDVRLVRAVESTVADCTSRSEQPVEVQTCADGKWYRVCAKSWNRRLSYTTCKELGHKTGCKYLAC